MRPKKQKGYWQNRTERFPDGTAAKTRAASLRNHQHVAHVRMEKASDEYVVTYSVAKWYLDELEKAAIEL